MTEERPAARPGWGVAVARTPRRHAAAVGRRLRAAAAGGTVAAAMLLGLAGVGFTAAAPAHADILGISDTVEDWICGIVAPDEPWEAVGDGPESLMSNRNLAGAQQVRPVYVDDSGRQFQAEPLPATVPDTMDELPALPGGDYTLYEVAGLRGLSWWTVPLAADGSRDCNLWSYVWTQSANLVFTLNKTALQVVIALKEAAAAEDPLSFLYEESSGAIATVFSVFFVPIASLMLILTGIWSAVNVMRRGRGTRAAVGAAGAAAAIIALAGFTYSVVSNNGTNGFRTVTAVVDQAINEVNAVATNAMFDGLAESTGSCALPADTGNAIRGQRMTSCVLADALAYRPWAIGQFGGLGADPIPLPAGWTAAQPAADGSIPAGELGQEQVLPCYVDFADCAELRSYLIAQHGGVQVDGRLTGQQGYVRCAGTAAENPPPWLGLTAALTGSVQLTGPGSDTPQSLAPETVCSPMFRVYLALKQVDPVAAQAYAGDVGVARVSQAVSSLLGTGVAGVPVLITAIISMGWTALTFALYVTGLFKLAFATYAGKSKLAKEWAGDLVHSWAARLAYGMVLSITILIIVWMLSSTLSFGLRLVWLGVILFFFWRLVQKVQELIRPGAATLAPNMAGDAQRRTVGAARTATRAAVGVGMGVAVAGQRRRAVSADPNRSQLRRSVSALTTPAALVAGGLRGAVGGPRDARHRAIRNLTRTPPAAAPAMPAPAAASTPNPPAVPRPTDTQLPDPPLPPNAALPPRPTPTADNAGSATTTNQSDAATPTATPTPAPPSTSDPIPESTTRRKPPRPAATTTPTASSATATASPAAAAAAGTSAAAQADPSRDTGPLSPWQPPSSPWRRPPPTQPALRPVQRPAAGSVERPAARTVERPATDNPTRPESDEPHPQPAPKRPVP